jgi:hypothetical protein
LPACSMSQGGPHSSPARKGSVLRKGQPKADGLDPSKIPDSVQSELQNVSHDASLNFDALNAALLCFVVHCQEEQGFYTGGRAPCD